MTKIPHDDILEGLYKFRIRGSDKPKTVLGLYYLEIHQKKLGPDYHRLKTMAKRSVEQDIRNKNFGVRNGNYETNAVVKNPGTQQCVQRILGDCWQWESNGQCSRGDHCSFRHEMNKRGKMTQSNPSPNSFMQQNEGNASRNQSLRGRSPSGGMSRWPCKDYLKRICKNSFCEKWHPPECLFYKTKSGCQFGEKCSYAHRQVDEQPRNRSKKTDDKSAVTMLKKNDSHENVRQLVVNLGKSHDRSGRPDENRDHESIIERTTIGLCLSRHEAADVYSPEEPRHAETNSTCKKSRRLFHVTLKFETKILRSDIFAQVNLISAAPTLQNLRIGLRRRQSGKSKVPRSTVEAGQKCGNIKGA